MLEPGAELEVLFDEGGWRVGLWRNLLFTGISKPPSASSLGHVRKGQERLLERPGTIGGLTLVTGLRLGPLDVSEEMRSEVGKMLNVPNVRGHSAIVIESDGFAAATIRAVLGAIIVLARSDSPQKFFETRAQAAAYLHANAPGGWTEQDLLAAANGFTQAFGK